MRVLVARLQAVLDPEAQRQRSKGGPSPLGSARSAGSTRQTTGGASVASVLAEAAAAAAAARAAGRSAECSRSVCSAKDSDTEESTAFDLMHTERGFAAFEQWYKRVLSSAPTEQDVRPEDLGLLWPQAYCPPNGLHEYAFVELLRVFAVCSEGEVFELFDLLDPDSVGWLGPQQVYVAICLVAAIGSQQLTKFLYFHSTRLFNMLSKGCRFTAAPGFVSFPRLQMLFRVVGVPDYLVGRASSEFGCSHSTELTYMEFVEIAYHVLSQLDRGADAGEVTVINEDDRPGHARSKMCTIL